MTKTICTQCGTVLELESPEGEEETEWLGCIEPTGFEWKLPAGKLSPIVGDPIYVSATGEHLSREAYIAKFGLDPEIAYVKMRAALGLAMKKPLRVGRG
jgi:hypothetical protein